jgi:YHS domain-containing protein
MKTLKRAALVTLLAATLPHTHQAAQQSPATDALDGLDPVLLVQGKEVFGKSALSSTRGGFVYLFSTAETKATFDRDPAEYEIQLGGLCARMGKTAGGNPSDYLVHDGKIYIFGSDECRKRFQAAPEKYLPQAATPLPSSKDAIARARVLLDRATKAMGAPDRIVRIASYVESGTQSEKRGQAEAISVTKTMWRFPDRVRQDRNLKITDATKGTRTITSSTILSPDGLWFFSGQGRVFPMIAAARASLELDFGRHPVALLRASRPDGTRFRSAALGSTTIEGTTVEQVAVANGAAEVVLNLAPEGRVHSVSFTDRNREGIYGRFTVLYSDFREVDGLKLPFAVRTLFNGQPDPSQTMTMDSIAVDVPLDLALFAPPPAGSK